MPRPHKPCQARVPGLSPHMIGCGLGMAQPLAPTAQLGVGGWANSSPHISPVRFISHAGY